MSNLPNQNRCILGIDTSGNTGNTLGTTGFAWIYQDWIQIPILEYIKALPEDTEITYFNKIIVKLENWYKKVTPKMYIVIAVEKYIEYHNKALRFQTSSTVKLNTIIEEWCRTKPNVVYQEKTASLIKNRWSDKVLLHEGFGSLDEFKKRKTKPYKDMIDALRHALHAYYFQDIKGN